MKQAIRWLRRKNIYIFGFHQESTVVLSGRQKLILYLKHHTGLLSSEANP